MMFDLFGDKPWFRAKSHGIGGGMPIAWQGWVLLGTYMAAMIGLGLFAEGASPQKQAFVVAAMVIMTVALLAISARHTEGGWRWRWGDHD